jgi:hypothetical protein
VKNTFIVTLVMAVASASGQGTVQFATRLTLGTPPYYTQVFMPDSPANKTGNTANNLPAGTQVYNSAALTGSGWTAQLFSIPGSTFPSGPFTSYGVPVSDPYAAAFPTTTFRTGTSAGSVAAVTATLQNVAPDAPSAVLQMRVFPTSYGSWAGAVTAYNSGDPIALIGASPAFVVNLIGGPINTTPPQMTMVSWSLPVPEPSSAALVGLGAACLLALRRRW